MCGFLQNLNSRQAIGVSLALVIMHLFVFYQLHYKKVPITEVTPFFGPKESDVHEFEKQFYNILVGSATVLHLLFIFAPLNPFVVSSVASAAAIRVPFLFYLLITNCLMQLDKFPADAKNKTIGMAIFTLIVSPTVAIIFTSYNSNLMTGAINRAHSIIARSKSASSARAESEAAVESPKKKTAAKSKSASRGKSASASASAKKKTAAKSKSASRGKSASASASAKKKK